jgi:hypothetical protein
LYRVAIRRTPGDDALMVTPQGGIFALGTPSHAYLEFDVSGGGTGPNLVAAVSALREPRTTMGGVNLVAGFRPELWRDFAPEDAPAATMLESMAGLGSGPRDALTRYTKALTGAYYFIPSADALRSAATAPSGEVAGQRMPDPLT